ncbi:GTPase HflX [Candidatus Peregrinibacteria bacterium RIFOXYB12_FULL_41_12]|nr:MAG: GTPase HflX [Candidatus Peregrinibacteria bacterium RIFOXYA2_FULL_41_18]OGJ49276.1 MAG: GTPase HflX [Candidatus Peregrinibacteria bacterium RIFOXYB12_FULL_41_12]OGJ54178.1 MAG: GTPase HflX [Candidatus Peregrinibacteria bacterium RIFOXYB2_FULL_41_88]
MLLYSPLQPLNRAIIVDVIPPEVRKEDAMLHLKELERLIETYGGITVLKIIQKRGHPSPRTYIGTGKMAEISQLQKELKANVVVINGFVKPNQFHNLTLAIDCEVLDRFELILRIFEKHAKTEKAKQQIRLAYLRYEFPRLFSKQAGHAQQRGGSGTVTRGKGETLLQVKREHLRNQIKEIEKKLETIQKVSANQRYQRKRHGFATASLVGYTNSGKSTILREITNKKNAYVADKLFATLETKLGKIYIENLHQPVLLADTIGFIKNLPPLLFESFITTLEEVTESELLIHVIDASDPEIEEKIETVAHILHELKCDGKPIITVFNKIDLVKNPKALLKRFAHLNPIPFSAIEHNGFENLKQSIKKKLT